MLVCMLAALAATGGATTALSANVPAVTAPPATPIAPTSLADLPAFVDGVVAEQIATRQVAGAVVTVVYRGNVMFTRGYGRADVDAGVTVDPKATLFRPGSVSKLFTWTALMQQVDLGRVDLDADVNRYLDFRIPDFQGAPIKVRDLLSHSPGMSDLSYTEPGLLSTVTDYRGFIKTHIPARLWPAGTEIAYSNYGAALAGYIVERVSGEPYPDYIERHIFTPLGMGATFREPLPKALADRMAKGYTVKDGHLVAKPFENFSFIMPAGSASATAPDMARFIQAMLGNGAIGGMRILSPRSVAYLESNSLANAPDLEGMAHGLMVARDANPRMLGHGGNTVDFHSYLLLVPSADFGFFVSMTGGPDSYAARTELSDAIIGHLFPTEPAPRWLGAGAPPPAGAYRGNRRDYSKPGTDAGDVVVATNGPHGVTTKQQGKVLYWEQIGPRLYEQVTGARAGGPFDRLELYGPASDPRLSFASSPHELFRLLPSDTPTRGSN
jgi:CubicO group peptidase (beta-lactamase class C family)